MGADGEFVLSLTLFKMMEALQIKEIDAMIRSLEQELSGVEVKNVTPMREVLPVQVPMENVSVNVVEKTVVKEPAPVVEEMRAEEVAQEGEPMVEAQIEVPQEVITPELMVETVQDEGAKLFEVLMAKMYDRNYDLGECFKHSIAYVSFENNLLTWESSASDEEKVLLRNNWGMIRMFVQEIFGFETKIKNISKELPSRVEKTQIETSKEPIQNVVQESYNPPMMEMEEPISMIEDEVLNQPINNMPPIDDEMPMKSSCIAPEAGDTEAAKEKDERTILDEPMVAKALELFAPKKVRVKRKA
jgi:DNA polymerase-3 subunit gamma/tau